VMALRAPLEVTRTRTGTSLWPIWPPALRGRGGGETAGADCQPRPDHTADGRAAACSEESSLSADQDVDQDGDDGDSSAVSTGGESVDSNDVPPAAFDVEEPAGEAGPAAELIGLPDPVIQDSVSSNEVQLPVTQFAENAEDLALFTYSVNNDLTEEACLQICLSCAHARLCIELRTS